MAATTSAPVTLDTPIIIKVLFRGQTRKLKLPLKDLGANVLPEKLRAGLQIRDDEQVVFERYSDSVAAYVTLDSSAPTVYKTLFRAAKAKLKLRLRATIPGESVELPAAAPPALPRAAVPDPSVFRLSSETLTPQAAAPVSPVIARSPEAPKAEAASPVSPLKSADDGEAPVPKPFTTRQAAFFDKLSKTPHHAPLANNPLTFRPKPVAACTAWVVYCNNCNHPMDNEHFHCSVCDNGDYDLCPACVDSGIHCPGDGHWMVKRFVKNGNVVNSTTQRIPPKVKVAETKDIPGAFTDEKQSITYEDEATRTCNSCVKVLSEKEFVTCTACEDYDLCLDCHTLNRHGHHPGHAFKGATTETSLSALGNALCNPGRNARHNAVCDGCDKFIYGVRHKCLNCPDWDYCSQCLQSAKIIHPRHRFVPIYEPLTEPLSSGCRHYGIYCDGPLCKDKENLSYIEGTRYKCAVCHDTDFCQNCEAHPSNKHNHTHPLIKFKTPVRNVSVTTMDEKVNNSITALGDRRPVSRRSTATETAPVAPSTNAATQVQTIVDMRPSAEPAKKEKIAIQDLLSEPIQEKPVIAKSENLTQSLDAHFIRDTVVDGSKICAGQQFVQVWTLRNPGPNAWPAGCSVRHVGGDNMLNIDNTRPLSQAELADASESNVVGAPVQIGEEVSFRVVMKAPQRQGTAISYWRLKTADGIPFGHRLWCDIQTVAPPGLRSTSLSEVAEASSSSQIYENLLQARNEKMKSFLQSQAQQLEQQKMERITQVRKAAVERLLENRRREHAAALASIRPVPILQPEEPAKELTAELPVGEKQIERQPAVQGSGMIFPQLDKESPESSTYETSTAQPVSPVSEKSTIARTVTVASDEEFFEDAESVALHSDDDEGFMTDEEYDILDASDEETQ
jgi:next-to-BRCA1 protein 1